MLLEGMKPRIPNDFASEVSNECELPTLQKAKQLSFRLSEAEKAAMAKEMKRRETTPITKGKYMYEKHRPPILEL